MNKALPLNATNTEPSSRMTDFCEKTILCLTGIFIFLNPFPHTTSIKEICFYLSAAMVLTMILTRSRHFSFTSPLSLSFVLYFLWSLASVFWSVDPGDSLHDVRAYLLELLFIYYLLVNFFNTEKRMMILIWIIVISTATAAIAGIIYYYLMLNQPLSARLVILEGGSINARATLNLVAVILALFCLTRAKQWSYRIISLACLSATTAALVLSYSRAALLGLVLTGAGLLIWEWRNRKKFFYVLISVIITFIVIMTYFYGSSKQLKRLQPDKLINNPRLVIYSVCLEIAREKPLTGIGFGMDAFKKQLWQKYSPKVPDIDKKWRLKKSAPSPHNFFLDILIRLGLIGTGIFVFIIVKTFQMGRAVATSGQPALRRWGAYLLASFTAMLIAGLFGPILDGPNGYNLYIVLAMITIAFNWSRQGDPARDYGKH
ncbi:MAG: O-antigen ligase family protein [Desulfosudaceae bacterium]